MLSYSKINPSNLLGIKKEEGETLKITTKGRYGLRALIDLAQYSEIEPVSISSIATRQGISERYLEQLMTLLKKAQLVKSIRGAGGGYVAVKDWHSNKMIAQGQAIEAWNTRKGGIDG